MKINRSTRDLQEIHSLYGSRSKAPGKKPPDKSHRTKSPPVKKPARTKAPRNKMPPIQKAPQNKMPPRQKWVD